MNFRSTRTVIVSLVYKIPISQVSLKEMKKNKGHTLEIIRKENFIHQTSVLYLHER